ncbi:MAG: 3-dehydroquinate synthase [Clostridiales bacterium]|nr:3-dehydroquinate synthase [Clostridiales bacterium]
MHSQTLIYSNNVAVELQRAVDEINPTSVFILTDSNTHRLVLPRILPAFTGLLSTATIITIQAGDSNKGLESLAHVWKELSDKGCTRRGLLINAGGGMVTDLGAFAASTFKRGIETVNVPTTLLAAVDASVGGKTGINFNGLKNEIGCFREARNVIISTCFYDTLPETELKSGYAEMLKHGLLTSAQSFDRLTSHSVTDYNPEEMLEMLRHSVEVKRKIVAEDPHENGIRRALNLGHTVGHAFESMAMERQSPIPHGYAVAYGLIVSLILSHHNLGLETGYLYRLTRYVNDNYGRYHITCDDYPRLLQIMGHDKKNESVGKVSFTLLRAPGEPVCGVTVPTVEIEAALDIYRDLTE